LSCPDRKRLLRGPFGGMGVPFVQRD